METPEERQRRLDREALAEFASEQKSLFQENIAAKPDVRPDDGLSGFPKALYRMGFQSKLFTFHIPGTSKKPDLD
jgi:hypothetical protein